MAMEFYVLICIDRELHYWSETFDSWNGVKAYYQENKYNIHKCDLFAYTNGEMSRVYPGVSQSEFDPSDWDSIRDMINTLKSMRPGATLTGENEAGERTIYYLNLDPYPVSLSKGEGSQWVLVVETYQDNDWIRINRYYPDDLVVDETYRK